MRFKDIIRLVDLLFRFSILIFIKKINILISIKIYNNYYLSKR